jgi:hypothetical protein
LPALSSGSLISIGLLCNHCCTVIFNATTVTIKKQGNTILSDARSATTGLWRLQLLHSETADALEQPTNEVSIHTANSVVAHDTIGERIAFYHASIAKEIDYQLAPPHVYRRNAAKRAIRTFKNHFVAGLCSTDKHFALHLWG